MSKRVNVAAEECVALGATGRRLESYPNRELRLGSLAVSRALPVKDRRMIGPWCFLDRFGPLSFSEGKPMDVAPHPHIGLQTVSWLLDGEVVHDDSLGCESLLRPGGVNVMTSGAGIAHAEQTPREHSGRLNGAQLWVALPDRFRGVKPSFHHVHEVPVQESADGRVARFADSSAGVDSEGVYYSDLIGADLEVFPGRTLELPLDPAFEHAALVMSGDCRLDGDRLEPRMLYYLGTQRSVAALSSDRGGRLLLVGGPPFEEAILMWWNFVARTPEEIAVARADWEERRRFGEVVAYRGPRLSAPSLLKLARAQPMS